MPEEIKKKKYEKKIMEREGSKEKRNEECFKGEGANSSDQNERKRIKDHEKEVKRVTLKDQERQREREREEEWGNIIYLCPSGNRGHLLPTL